MGETLDYRNPRTKRLKNPPTPRARLGFRLAYVATTGIVLALGLDALWASRVDPNGGTDALGAGLLFALFGLGAILITSLLWIVRLWRYRENWGIRAACTIPILMPLFILVLTVPLVLSGLPFQWAFNYSRPALERAAAEIRRDPTMKIG